MSRARMLSPLSRSLDDQDALGGFRVIFAHEGIAPRRHCRQTHDAAVAAEDDLLDMQVAAVDFGGGGGGGGGALTTTAGAPIADNQNR